MNHISLMFKEEAIMKFSYHCKCYYTFMLGKFRTCSGFIMNPWFFDYKLQFNDALNYCLAHRSSLAGPETSLLVQESSWRYPFYNDLGRQWYVNLILCYQFHFQNKTNNTIIKEQ